MGGKKKRERGREKLWAKAKNLEIDKNKNGPAERDDFTEQVAKNK